MSKYIKGTALGIILVAMVIGTAWLGLVLVNAQYLLGTRQAASSAQALAMAAATPVW